MLIFGLAATKILKVPEVKLTDEQKKAVTKLSVKSFFEEKALPMAIIIFFVSLGFASILGFITSYEKEQNLLEAGKYFFVVYSIFTVFSRPFTGRLFDKKGDNFVMYPSFLIFAIGLFILSITTNEIMLLTVAACMGLGFGTYMSCAQAITIKLSPKHRIGLATSTFFIFMDLGVGFGPLLLGMIVPILKFKGLYILMGITLIICAILYSYLKYRKI